MMNSREQTKRNQLNQELAFRQRLHRVLTDLAANAGSSWNALGEGIGKGVKAYKKAKQGDKYQAPVAPSSQPGAGGVWGGLGAGIARGVERYKQNKKWGSR